MSLDISSGPGEPCPQAAVILSEGTVLLKRSHAHGRMAQSR